MFWIHKQAWYVSIALPVRKDTTKLYSVHITLINKYDNIKLIVLFISPRRMSMTYGTL